MSIHYTRQALNITTRDFPKQAWYMIATISLQIIVIDYVALAQEYIKIKHEYKVIFYRKKLQFSYLKNNTTAKYSDNLNSLHWQRMRSRNLQARLVVSLPAQLVSLCLSKEVRPALLKHLAQSKVAIITVN